MQGDYQVNEAGFTQFNISLGNVHAASHLSKYFEVFKCV